MRIGAHIFYNGKYKKGTVYIEKNRIIDFIENDVKPEITIAEGFINAHTHIGDSFIDEVPRQGIMELVGPGGFKQRMLESANDKKIIDGMKKSINIMKKENVRAFFDFRESGIRGLKLIKSIKTGKIRAMVLSRPSGIYYDENELDYLLENSEGIGMSSISDYDFNFLLKISRRTKDKGKIFSIHGSERVREDIDKIMELRPDFLIHLHRATDEDLDVVANKKIPVVITPRSSLFFGININFKRFLERGIVIALGTDNAMIATPSIRVEMSFAYYLGMDPIDVIKASTIAMDRFINDRNELYFFKSKPGEIVKNPYLAPVKKLNIENGIL
jgi:cytosine/adenosine deaminase-related metal-dependent hydrolase